MLPFTPHQFKWFKEWQCLCGSGFHEIVSAAIWIREFLI
ncbi:hypothetical protein ACPOL_0190 [Acidisarcina polymorpha]|uniref:Uncharacterized protein n=1 Tax=Acidisarcina polymorpha TaxID=2211140 RepID=A0A2Z5FSW1_9BACT|nr:hypothetical protein ACPOL_0190 [Acidisarcina polymorpha]